MKFLVHPSLKDVFIEIIRTKEHKTLIRWWNYGFDGNNLWIVPVKKNRYYEQTKQWINSSVLANGWTSFDPDVDKHPGRTQI